MQAVILAAGMGKRLGDLTRHSTKCMVKVNGKRLIEHALDALLATGIRHMVMVVGHGADELKALLGNEYKGARVDYVLNPIYAKSNNIYSLFLVRAFMEAEDSLLLESDVIFDPAIIEDCLDDPAPNLAIVAKFQSWMDGTVTKLDDREFISCFVSKKEIDWSDLDQYFKTVNIYKLSKEFSKEKFFPFLEVYIRAKGLNEYYEEVLKVLTFIDQGSIKALDISDRLWYEIDDLQDLDIADALFSRGLDKLKALHQRYGGYWRFPALKDFCYLVNPYFPTPRMVHEMIRSFPQLLTSYPSGQKVQNLLGSKMLGCSPQQVLVGNGASELIKGLLPECGGPVALSVPTFDEYRACAPKDQWRVFHPMPGTFAYSADQLADFCAARKVSTLILINPDNPSGHFISRTDAVRLLERLQAMNVRLIYDESFADFVDGTTDHSLISPDILDRFPNLVAVKSISKSYGVPGLRLGIIASGDGGLLERVRSRLAIWNINSFAEHFLQIIEKYNHDFRHACRNIGAEREHLFERLREISFLRPIPSKANYILCEVKAPWTPTRLAETLLNASWLFIKDCTGKIGFEKTPCVRLTVRDRNDNEFLLSALKALEK
ncbi:MAG: aminotransferase class I/II-fold pyridoxal phosphate-dependent enzyme [Candidatus Aminicenantes bacterium]|nr:aminotransferase class I/II-fold pyridoxal phosphate-dependent enzyme [Candidatus Aminicenantes bacterium]